MARRASRDSPTPETLQTARADVAFELPIAPYLGCQAPQERSEHVEGLALCRASLCVYGDRGLLDGLFLRGVVEMQDFDGWRLGQNLAETVHPIAGFLTRSNPFVAKLVELIELFQFDLELQRCAVAMTAR